MRERLSGKQQPPYVAWSEQWGEWIVVIDGTGHRYYFDCKAEAEEYLRLASKHGQGAYIWRNLDKWFKSHKHDFQCRPHWQRGKHGNNN